VLGSLCAGEGNQAASRRRRAAALGQAAAGGGSSSSGARRRVLCVSDLHVDQGKANMAWLEAVSSSSFRDDVLIIAGGGCVLLGATPAA
jgi:hypothetical protein